MEKEIKGFITSRCQEALMENMDYMQKERSGNTDQEVLQIIAEEICYKKGFRDAIAIILKK